jgi:steroid 5-alpha reductase family enzyme
MRERPVLKGRFRFGLFNLFFISFYQHFLILLFSAPLLLAAKNSERSLTWIDIAAIFFMLFFLIIETVADNQQFRFQKQKRRMPASGKIFEKSLKKGFLTEGLWAYVRHPNFVAEQAVWVSFYFFGVSASGNWINWTLTGPLLLILLFQGSTQLTERISGEKYPDYAKYKKSVPKFLPRLLLKGTIMK